MEIEWTDAWLIQYQGHIPLYARKSAYSIVNHVGFSYIHLHGLEHVVNRFYLEDYTIGKLMPLFNVDIER